MRTDVKLGLLTSFIVVVLAGWYFADRGDSDTTIPIETTDRPLTLASPSKSKPPATPTKKKKLPPAKQPSVKKRTPTRPSPAAAKKLAQRKQAQKKQIPQRRVSKKPIPRKQTRAPRKSLGEKAVTSPDVIKREEVTSIIADMLKVRKDDAPADRVQAGAKTKVPASPATRPVAPKPTGSAKPTRPVTKTAKRPRMETHTVRKGDTIMAIARLYYGNMRYTQALLNANPQIVGSGPLVVGSKINIPAIDAPTPSAPVATAQPVKPHSKNLLASRPLKRAARGYRTHTVQAGDSLYRIARNTLGEGSRWEEIYELNKAVIGDDPTALKLGTVLKLPRK